jgi:large subunit ribosomal protein L24e
MVVKRQCSFCAQEIEPGTGSMFVKRDGTVYTFCSSSCRKQQLVLGRVGHRFKWTRAYELKKAAERSNAAARAPPAPSVAAPVAARAPAAEAAPEVEEPPAAEAAAPAAKPAATAKPARAAGTKTGGSRSRAKPKSESA